MKTPDEREDAVWESSPDLPRPRYLIDERPRAWWECLLYGWQHTLVDISPFVLPLAVAAALEMNPSEQAQLINFCLLSMGVATLIQTTLGNRLPIIQGPSATLTGTLAPVAGQMGGPAMWGAVMVGAVAEMAIGASRMLSRLKHLLPPLVSGVVILTIGISLGQLAVRLMIGDGRTLNFLLAGAVLASIFLLQTLFPGSIGAQGAVFFSIWLIGIGVAGPLGAVDWALVADKPWIQLPSLFPYGGPGFGWEFAAAAILAVFAGYLGSMVESIGDYAATCAVAGERFTVRHMNRGIFAEGLGCAVASVLGGLPCTSYTQNIGIIAATRVASRLVVQVAALVLILYGLCPKFGALLVAMPRSVLGGVFVLVCGMIAMSGLRLMGGVKPTAANLLVGGTTLILAVSTPPYVTTVLGPAWLGGLPTLARLVLTNSIVLAVLFGVGLNWAAGILGRSEDSTER